MESSRKVIALENRFRACRNVITLGVKPNFGDYPPRERQMILDAPRIYYPSTFYADLFDAAGKEIFPSYHTYKCVQDKIKQTALFDVLGIPHPRTRIFYGRRQQAKIIQAFTFPFIAKIPRGSAMGRGVFFIRSHDDLDHYLSSIHPAYIQEHLDIDRDIRVVIMGRQIVHAYWRIAAPGEFRSNLSLGGRISLRGIPGEARAFALEIARKCRWNDVGLDICIHGGKLYVLEANMKYGKMGFKSAGIDYYRLVDELIAHGKI